jgi:hypothetical protein
MTIERYLRLIAGFFVMLSVALGYWVNPAWFLFTAFVGLNLFQSAFTNWCPMMSILRKGRDSREQPTRVYARSDFRGRSGMAASKRSRPMMGVNSNDPKK